MTYSAVQEAPMRELEAKKRMEEANQVLEEAEARLKAATEANVGMPPPPAPDAEVKDVEISPDPATLTVAQLQEELGNRGLDIKWDPLKGKKMLQDRLQVLLH